MLYCVMQLNGAPLSGEINAVIAASAGFSSQRKKLLLTDAHSFFYIIILREFAQHKQC